MTRRTLSGRVGRRPTMRSAQIARSVTADEARPEVGLPPVTAGRRAFSLTFVVTDSSVMPDRWTRCGHAWSQAR